MTIQRLLRKYNNYDHKVNVWNAFVDSNLTGVNEDDCTILPRLLPASYLPTIRKTARDLTEFCLKVISQSPAEIKALIPSGPIRDFLIDDLEVLKYRPQRLVGSLRFDMAIVGKPADGNPPKLLEVNEIGFDGLFRSSFIQETLLNLIPGLRPRTLVLDNAQSEISNMKRLGRRLARFQYDSYNWEEELLLQYARKEGLAAKLLSPGAFKAKIDPVTEPLLQSVPVSLKKGRLCVGGDFKPDFLQMGFSFELSDYQENPSLYRSLVRSGTPQYGPFISGLIASKYILVLLSDPLLRRKFLGSAKTLAASILPAVSLKDNEARALSDSKSLVLKHIDGLGGEMVFMNRDLVRRLKKIPRERRDEWVLQEKTFLNTLQVNGILSRPRQVISDLGVFVQYDWSRKAFNHFALGGFITRATNRAYTVNVSGGGIQVPVMFLKGK